MSKYQPDRKFYLSLLLFAMAITVFALLIPTLCPWFTIVTGIGCGGIASVIVAWLIDEANCREKEKRNRAIYAIPWAELSMLAYFYSIFYHVLNDEDPDNKKDKHTWSEWKNMLVSKLNENANEGESDKFKTVFDDNTKGVIKQLEFISDNRFQLMADGLLSESLFYSLGEIKQKLELCRTMIHHSTCKEVAWWFSSLADTLYRFFEKDEELKKYNDLKFHDLVDYVKEYEKKTKKHV